MTYTDFNQGWSYRRKVTPFQELGGTAGSPWTPVTLPHDALITTERRADAPDGHTNGYFTGGTFEYRKTFAVSEEDRGKPVYLEFDGVYRDAVVTVNGALAGRHAFGYSRFLVRVDPHLRSGADNEVRVSCRTHLDSRWYTGCGIHRDVRLIVKNPAHIAVDGVRVTTPDVDHEVAIAEVTVRVRNMGAMTSTLRLAAVVTDEEGTEVARGRTPLTLLPADEETARLRLLVDRPRLWSAETPARYRARVWLTDGEQVVDEVSVPFGIRTIQVDARRGLRVNGTEVKLRGACLHGDNGPLGAAAIGRAEERKIELLKAAGFNAIRSSHHPASSALLDACDRLGMYVMDEAFDMWTQGKSDFDYSADFPEWWERDLEAMVAKDLNHPSVVFYSIGNEIPETGTPDGGRWSRRLAEKLRALDGTRLVTNGINGFVSVLDLVLGGMAQRRAAAQSADVPGDEQAGGGVNGMMNAFGEMMGQIISSPMVTERTEESFAALDVAGMNYGESRYALDHDLFPDRVIVGTETWPTVIDRNWALVEKHPHVIGDFTWTGLDYLGETGIGVVKYAAAADGGQGFSTAYPGLSAFCGDLDLTGHRRPVSYYREIVFGRRSEPYIAVRRPEHHGVPVTVSTPWAWSDSVSSWSWPGFEDAPVHVEVYAEAEEVELLLDGESLGRAPVGTERAFQADFEVLHHPGELVAVAYRAGAETGRTLLVSARKNLRLTVAADRDELCAGTRDLAFVALTLTDDRGVLQNALDRDVRVTVSGAGILQGLGSGAPVTGETFHGAVRRTFDGRALAVVRPTGSGTITVEAVADGCAPARLALTVTAARSPLTDSPAPVGATATAVSTTDLETSA
ncbi:glycoside hydrolase family 2 TIM barrel-domain containing protein [Streptomyces sp. NPDC006175]|uniref:glycoside hydrolase family 2 protein n=1 Tax=unclassified Streptomyces TaxID=2593676 RepID=UPI0033B52F2D